MILNDLEKLNTSNKQDQQLTTDNSKESNIIDKKSSVIYFHFS
jgi:hypothetical protein